MCPPVCNPADTFTKGENDETPPRPRQSVDDLAQSIRFYSTLFSAEPTVIKDDYAKWMLDDPRVNFAISTVSINRPGGFAGISHLGIQAEDETELAEVYDRLARAERPIVEAKRDLLLCQIRQTMDRRSAGRALGDLPDLRRERRFTVRVRWQAARSPRAHAGCVPPVS